MLVCKEHLRSGISPDSIARTWLVTATGTPKPSASSLSAANEHSAVRQSWNSGREAHDVWGRESREELFVNIREQPTCTLVLHSTDRYSKNACAETVQNGSPLLEHYSQLSHVILHSPTVSARARGVPAQCRHGDTMTSKHHSCTLNNAGCCMRTLTVCFPSSDISSVLSGLSQQHLADSAPQQMPAGAISSPTQMIPALGMKPKELTS